MLIDLDNAAQQCGAFEAVVVLHGRSIRLRDPALVGGSTTLSRGGLPGVVSALWRRAAGLLLGTSPFTALRNEVLSGVDGFDAAGIAFVRQLPEYDLCRLQVAMKAAYAKRLSASVEGAFAKAGTGGLERGGAPGTGEKQEASSADSPVSERLDERHVLRRGGGRLPGVMNGGPVWGRAAVDADPEKYLAALEARGAWTPAEAAEYERLKALIEERRGRATGTGQQNNPAASAAANTEVTHGG
ncbi:MAG: hypothetical protein ACKVZJ_10300 [Phycisphaerales bacterium]